jgi:lipopolysaccharide biosynthesis protein
MAPRVIAFYLPQFHPIPENDEWWGSGFTEWTNVAKARSLFPGHYQPHVPADLGFYDLRVSETRAAQAELARRYGISAFCYWHYWFGGRRILERPFAEVLKSSEPDFPFCLGWANQTWSGVWHGEPHRVLIEQTYPGPADHERHFYALLDAFTDDRYFKVDGKPLFYVYQPLSLPEPRRVSDLWRELAHRNGLKGLHLVGETSTTWLPEHHGFDATVRVRLPLRLAETSWKHPWRRARTIYRQLRSRPTIYSYRDAVRTLLPDAAPSGQSYPCVIPNWDNTPRSGVNGLVLHDSTPEAFGLLLRRALQAVSEQPPDRRIVFIKSWNEWAEGNHLEPDRRHGHGYLQVVAEELARAKSSSADGGVSPTKSLTRNAVSR